MRCGIAREEVQYVLTNDQRLFDYLGRKKGDAELSDGTTQIPISTEAERISLGNRLLGL